MPTVSLPTYDVIVEPGVLQRAGDVIRAAVPAHRYAVISDDSVAALYARRLMELLGDSARLFTVPPGERHKTRESWALLTDAMLAEELGRDSAVVALGGGVVGDLAGFVAATYMRGLQVVQIPTTLLAMVDSSVGGKTAVDTPAGKNLVGAFHQPALVLADPLVLETLPREHRRAGVAEMMKHGVVADASYFENVLASLSLLVQDRAGTGADADRLAELIAGGIAIKADVVRRDERESGLRKVLNFGHTIGHAVEALTLFEVLHGEAVAMGMVAEARMAEAIGVAADGTATRIEQALRAAGLPHRTPGGIAPGAIVERTHGDKKARRGRTEYALPARIGAMAGEAHGWAVPIEDAVALRVLAAQ